MSGGCRAQMVGIYQYLRRDDIRARLKDHLPDTTKEPRRHRHKCFAQGSATGGVQDHWTAEELEEHLIAASREDCQRKKVIQEGLKGAGCKDGNVQPGDYEDT